MRQKLFITGIVQGVGFRPFVYSLAVRHGLAGFVLNTGLGVEAEVQGPLENIESFLLELPLKAPPLAVIEEIRKEIIHESHESSRIEQTMQFEIRGSVESGEKFSLISPDIATCDDCLDELLNPADRRCEYPFTNCTNCGPRFTIIEDVPYDRPHTTMSAFPMCPDCAREYSDPADRRFHAQPNACSVCGPWLRLAAPDGSIMAERKDALSRAAEMLRAGKVLAIKGLGGYHLACDATDEQAVSALRARKFREDKPFAVMVNNVGEARRLCAVSEDEEKALTSVRRPIVLLRRIPDAPVAPSVAPNNPYLGVMLPYAPVHHLLLAATGRPLVMTSGNRSDEPIAYVDERVFEHVRGIADAFLMHNRAIHMRCDDSVARVWRGRERIVRRSRGYAPAPVSLSNPAPMPILACGAELKNTFCLARGRHAFLSHHIGDLDNIETLTSYEEGILHFERLFHMKPEAIAYDLHPEYLASKYALERDDVERKIGVQHHHAHIAACLADNSESGPAIGVAMDGLGYGLDGVLWGGEWLVADAGGFVRAAHLRPLPMQGGAAAIKQPWRMAMGTLYAYIGDDLLKWNIPALQRLDEKTWPSFRLAMDQRINCPLTTSMGRIFDVASCLVTGRAEVNYEGQAAVELELLAGGAESDAYGFVLASSHHQGDCWGRPPVAPALFHQCLQLDFGPAIMGMIYDLQKGKQPRLIAAGFHSTAAAAIVETCNKISEVCGISTVALSGGVFQNLLLLDKTARGLEESGFRVLTHSRVPTNDGGLSLGQTAIAAEALK